MNLFSVTTTGPFPDKGPGKSVFHDKGTLKVQSINIRAGQSIPPCAMDHDAMFYVIKGAGEIIVDTQSAQLYPGAGVVVLKEAKSREMHAHEDLTILAVQGRQERP